METAKRLLVIINPCAGKMSSRGGLFDIANILCQSGYTPTIYTTAARGDATRYAQQHALDYDGVICCGGDGTLNEVINGVMQLPRVVPIGYIPAGTTNDFASSLGLPKTIKKATENIISGTPHPQDVGLFNGRYFSYIASFGAFTKTSYSTSQKLKNALGHMAYIFSSIKELGDIKPHRLTVDYEGGSFEDEFIFGAVSNSTSVAGIVKLRQDEVDLSDGKFEVMLIRAPRNPADLHGIIQSLTSQKYSSRYLHFFHASHIRFRSEKALSWTLDGECGGDHTLVEIENLHHAIQIVTSSKAAKNGGNPFPPPAD